MADARIQARIDFLKKNRPNDPEIKKLQSKLGGGQQGQTIGGVGGMGDPAATPAAPMTPAQPLPKVATDYASDIAASSGVNQAFDPNLSDRPLNDDLIQARLEQQQQLEDYLGRDIDSAYEKARKQQEQQLFNRGIPLGSEQYIDGMKMLDDNFARQRADIRAQALQFGGQEMQSTFQMGEEKRANQLNEQLAANQTNMGNIGAFSDIDLAYKNLQQQKKQANMQNSLAQQQLAKQGGGGGSSTTSAPIVQSPFVG